ncbi:MAG: carboxypeptidase regulatory-like domain-containing protein, partial [Blastocatellia bacterium]|nr:carboxypeptidase regulatory-like domain-containing protein [Blastocatellia bacterium]
MFKTIKEFHCILLTILFFFMLATPNILAQSSGSTSSAINGQVIDGQKSAISSATLTIKNIATNFTREIIPNSDGSFSFRQLPPGNYQLTVQA